jgi:hypothetical protein
VTITITSPSRHPIWHRTDLSSRSSLCAARTPPGKVGGMARDERFSPSTQAALIDVVVDLYTHDALD